MAINVESEEREDGTRHTKRYDIDPTKCVSCGFCEEACSTDAVMGTHIFKYHGERKGDLHMTEPTPLVTDDKYGPKIAKRKATDTPYR